MINIFKKFKNLSVEKKTLSTALGFNICFSISAVIKVEYLNVCHIAEYY